MISIFIPILLLRFDYSITELMIYYLIFNIFDFPLNFFARWTIRKFGAKKTIILGILALIAYFACLYNLGPNNWSLLIVMALCAALYDTWYWGAHIYYFMKCSKHDKNVAGDTSLFYIVKRIAGMLAPIIGAAILIFTGQHILIIISVIVLALSLWPLFKIKDTKDRPKEGKVMSMREFFKGGSGLREYILQGLCSFHYVAEGIIWPIFIYTLFGSIESVAIIPVIVSLTVIIFTYFTGKIKKANRNKAMILGGILITITWILRLVLANNIFYYISVFLIGMFAILVSLPLDCNIFEKGEKRDALAASIYRNTFSMFPRIIFYGALVILLEVFKVSFITAAVSMFVFVAINFLFIVRKKSCAVRQRNVVAGK